MNVPRAEIPKEFPQSKHTLADPRYFSFYDPILAYRDKKREERRNRPRRKRLTRQLTFDFDEKFFM